MNWQDDYRTECADCGYRDEIRVPTRGSSSAAVIAATKRHVAYSMASCQGNHLRVVIVERAVPRCDFCDHDTSTDFEPHCCEAMLNPATKETDHGD